MKLIFFFILNMIVYTSQFSVSDILTKPINNNYELMNFNIDIDGNLQTVGFGISNINFLQDNIHYYTLKDASISYENTCLYGFLYFYQNGTLDFTICTMNNNNIHTKIDEYYYPIKLVWNFKLNSDDTPPYILYFYSHNLSSKKPFEYYIEMGNKKWIIDNTSIIVNDGDNNNGYIFHKKSFDIDMYFKYNCGIYCDNNYHNITTCNKSIYENNNLQNCYIRTNYKLIGALALTSIVLISIMVGHHIHTKKRDRYEKIDTELKIIPKY